MRARVGPVLSSPRQVNGGSPQGSILGNLLFTVMTDWLSKDISYTRNELNRGELEDSDQNSQVVVLDMSLARVVGDSPSELGINNITVESLEEEHTVPFEQNGSLSQSDLNGMPEYSYYKHEEYTQSTPTVRGQFQNFVPPGNIINTCLDEQYSSTSGMTFVYMQGHKGNAAIADSTDELLRSALLLSQSNEALNNSAPDPPNWLHRENIIPFTYIDDSNGCE